MSKIFQPPATNSFPRAATMKLTLAQRIENMFTFLYAEPDGSMCHFDKTFLDEVKAAAIRGATPSETAMPDLGAWVCELSNVIMDRMNLQDFDKELPMILNEFGGRFHSGSGTTPSATRSNVHPDNIEVMISSLLSVVWPDMREAAGKDLLALVEMASATRSATRVLDADEVIELCVRYGADRSLIAVLRSMALTQPRYVHSQSSPTKEK